MYPNNNTSLKDKIVLLLLFIIIFTATIAYSPSIYANEGLYALFRYANIVVIGLLFVLSFNAKRLFKHRFISGFLYPTIFMLIILVLLKRFGLDVDFSEISVIINAFMAMWVGYEAKLGAKYVKQLLIFHAIIAVVVGYEAIQAYLGSFSLESSLYLLDGKNQIGVIVATASFAMMYLSITSDSKSARITSIILCVILFSLLVLIRCRTALVALLLGAFITINKILSGRKLSIFYIVLVLLICVFSSQIISVFKDVFILDREISDVNDLTTGRMDRNAQAIEYIPQHIMEGEMISQSYIELIHNYVLKNLVKYGVWCIPMLICYIMLIFKVYKQTILQHKFTLYDIGFFILILPLFCSLLEPGAPFGPGSVMLFPFILFGISSKNSLNNNINN